MNLKPTAANLKHARRQREEIVAEIRAGTFDLARYFPSYKFATRHQPDAPEAPTFGESCETWLRLMARSLEHSTVSIYRRHLLAYWRGAWERLQPARITHAMVLDRLSELAEARIDINTGKVSEGLGRKTQNNILIPLRGVFDYLCRAPGSTMVNPVDGIDNLKVQKPAPDPFTLEEVEVIIADIGMHEGAAWADYFEFACFAGLRPSEQIAAPWADADLRSGTLRIAGAFVMGKAKERTKTNAERLVELNDRAAAVLERQRPRTQLVGGVIFVNPTTGRPFAGEQEQLRVWTRALRRCGIRHRPPKECRDTSVTLALLSGADPYYVAMQHGHSLQTMMKSYQRWRSRPQCRGHQLGAGKAG